MDRKTSNSYHVSFISNSYFYSLQRPYLNEAVAIGDRFINNIKEEYFYENEKLTMRKILNADNNNIVYIKEIEYNNDDILSIREKKYNDAGEMYYLKDSIFEGSYVEETTIMYPDFESSQKYRVDKIDEYLDIIYYDGNEPYCFLKSQDEIVSFRALNDKIYPYTTSLNFKLDPYFDFPFVLNDFHGASIKLNY
jgi:hypothetical protein